MDIVDIAKKELEKLTETEKEISNIDFKDKKKVSALYSRQKRLNEIKDTYDNYLSKEEEIKENEQLLKDPELRELAGEEIESLRRQNKALVQKLKLLLKPEDPNENKDIVVEIRAGAGGAEASLFVGDLYRMYDRFAAQIHNLKVELVSSSPVEGGGYREIVTFIKGKSAWSLFRYEMGVHRVQRIPVTESQGRIHTSTATVAVLPQVDQEEVNIAPEDLKIDVYRSSGPGGQCVNTTDSAVRITHIPTGIVVTQQDEKSQFKNKAKGMMILRARIAAYYKKIEDEKLAKERKEQVKTGDRSFRIRTYNFPQNRVTDHRIGITIYHLDAIMDGELDQIVGPLLVANI
ncbi:MAG: peptide chain release factor 1 [bacterium]|nr:MAG: peptide chain release factor 1 [bacterium]